MGIIEKLFELKKSEDFDAALKELRAALQKAQLNVSALKSEARSAPFDRSAAALSDIRKRIRDGQDEIETLEGLIEEAARRQDEAELAERAAAVEASMVAARADRSRVRKEFAAFDASINALSASIEVIASLEHAINQANQKARDAGMPALAVRTLGPNVHIAAMRERLTDLSRLSCSSIFDTMEANGRLD